MAWKAPEPIIIHDTCLSALHARAAICLAAELHKKKVEPGHVMITSTFIHEKDHGPEPQVNQPKEFTLEWIMFIGSMKHNNFKIEPNAVLFSFKQKP